jgi:hypothetical protein
VVGEDARSGTLSDKIEIVVRPEAGFVVALLRGVLSMQTVAATLAALTKLLATSERVVVDLSCVELRHPGCVAVFGAATQQAGGWPDAKLALLAADPSMLTHLARVGGSIVPVADSITGNRHRSAPVDTRHRRPVARTDSTAVRRQDRSEPTRTATRSSTGSASCTYR